MGMRHMSCWRTSPSRIIILKWRGERLSDDTLYAIALTGASWETAWGKDPMFSLAWGKRRTGHALNNRPSIANASMTFIDGCLATGILVALLADGLFGWWWADPLAAAIVGLVALNEARENWRG